MLAIVGLTTLLASLVAAAALPTPNHGRIVSARAVYFMSNNGDGNQIYALPVNSSGLVSDGTVTETGGKGAYEGSPTPGDSLGSQASLQINGNMLYAVNAGSNTVTQFEIDAFDPLKLTMVGQPVDTMGDFPNSIGLSPKLQLACVTNSGTRANIVCFRMTAHGLKPYDKTPRPVTLSPVQANPPNGPPNTVSQVSFNYDNTALITLVKGDPFTNSSYGYVSYFPIHNGEISRQETRSTPEGTSGLFGFTTLPNGNILATDLGFGVVLLRFDKKGVASTLYKYVVPNQGATCWTTQSALTGTIYTTDAAFDTIGGYSPLTGHPIVSSTQNGTDNPGVTLLPNGNNQNNEIVASGSLLYTIAPGGAYPGKPGPPQTPKVVVMKQVGLSGVEALQNFEPKVPAGSTLDDAIMGIAVLEHKLPFGL